MLDFTVDTEDGFKVRPVDVLAKSCNGDELSTVAHWRQ